MKKKCYKLVLMSALLIVALTLNTRAQVISPCGTDEVMNKLYAEHPELIQQQVDYDNLIKQIIKADHQSKSAEAVYIVPVVFHIIYSTPGGAENISDAAIYNEMDTLNRDYAKLNWDTILIVKNSPFDTLASRINIQFRLATLDPNGNCTNGIDRIRSQLSLNASDNAKLNQWPRDKYLNIWTVASIGGSTNMAAAYALYPSATVNYPQGDGVLSMASYVGTVTSREDERTITHEVGHTMNLEHVWGNNNNAAVACGDDGVDDTPITKGHLYVCNATPHCTRSFANHIVYNFNGLYLSQGTMDPTITTDTTAILGHFSANNVSPTTSEGGRFSFTGWDIGATNGDTSFTALTGSIDTSKYYQVTIGPNANNNMLINAINFNIKRSATGIRTFAVRSSANGFASNLSASISPANPDLSVRAGNTFFYKKDTTTSESGCHISLSSFVNSLQTITFRFYGWNAEDAAGTFSIDDVNFATVNNHGADTIIYNFNSANPPTVTGVTDPTAVQVDTAVSVGHFSAIGVSANPIESTRFSYTNWTTGIINGTVISMVVDSNATGYNVGDTFNPVGGTPTTAAVGTVSNLEVVSATLTSSGISGYVPAQTLTLATGTGTHATLTVATTKVVGTPVMTAAGSNYTAGDTLILATGVGTKATIIVDAVNSGAILTFHLATGGSYATNPTLLSDAVTGGTGTGAKFTLKMGVNSSVIASGGSYTVVPTLTGDTATGGGIGAAWTLLIGVKTVTFTGGAYSINSTNFPITFTGAATTNITGSGTGLTVTFGIGPVPTGSIDTSQYYQVVIGPKYANTMSFTGMSFDIKRNLTGVRSFAVRSSVNNFAANLAATISPANPNLSIQGTNEFFYNDDTDLVQSGCHITLSGASYTNILAPITYRFYGWNAEDLTGSFSIDNVSFVDTAGLIENFDNYMDYSYCGPSGQRMFTKGQKDRMRAALESPIAYRNNLYLNSNLIATGTQDPYPPTSPCVPTPDFYANRQEICAGGTVTFTSNSLNISQGNTPTKAWTFAGGTPSSSTAANPTVTFSTPGDYDVTLNLTNPSGTGTITKNTYVHVYPHWAQYTGDALENFENSSSFYWNWVIDNYDNNQHAWGLINFAGYSGNHSMVMNGFGDYYNDLDDFITPGFDLFNLTGGALTFRCAAATSALNGADNTDALRVYASTDCGQTWGAARLTLIGSALCNNGYSANSFIPTSQSQWALCSVAIPPALAQGDVKFKFEYKAGPASNNIYIDDINITGTVGITESVLDNLSLSVFPNPTNDASTLQYHLNTKGNVKIEVIDILGKKVMEINNKNQAEGDYSYLISKQEHNLNNGVYFIKFSFNDNSITKKLIFTE